MLRRGCANCKDVRRTAGISRTMRMLSFTSSVSHRCPTTASAHAKASVPLSTAAWVYDEHVQVIVLVSVCRILKQSAGQGIVGSCLCGEASLEPCVSMSLSVHHHSLHQGFGEYSSA